MPEHTKTTATGRVVTLTTNPTLDAISEVTRGRFVETLQNRDVVRVNPFRYQVGGKGVTCARVLKAIGGNCLAVVLLGKDGLSRCVEHYLLENNLKTKILRTGALGRVCLIVTEVEGEEGGSLVERATTGVDYRINGGGSPIDQYVFDNLLDVLRRSLHGAASLALAGSLPESAPKDFYAQCIRLAKGLVPLVTLDSSGHSLLHGAEARPHLIKINAQEAAALMQEPTPTTIQETAGLAWRIVTRFNEGRGNDKGIDKVVITLGAQGAAAVDAGARVQWAVKPPRVRAQGALGAGDSFSAGLSYGFSAGRDFTEALRWGAACGAATAQKRAGEVADLESVRQLFTRVEIIPLEVQAEAAAASVPGRQNR